MISNELYYAYAVDRTVKEEPRYYLIHITISEGKWMSHELSEPMTMGNMTSRGITLVNSIGSVDPMLPAVHKDEKGIVHLDLELFSDKIMYHKYNPKRVFPLKPELFRTVTLLGMTRKEEKKYEKYHMTNREFLLLNEHHRTDGYYVCDYNGAVAYITTEQMLSIMNRYGATNAGVSGDGIYMSDGSSIPEFSPPEDADELKSEVYSGLNKKDTVKYLDNDDDTEKYDIKKLRFYADTFFTLRRRRLKIESDSPEANKKAVADEFRRSIEAYHQAVIRDTVSLSEYERISKELDTLSNELESDNNKYHLAEREILSQIRSAEFARTDAFDDMLEMSGDNIKRLVNLQTLCDFSSDIVKRYSHMLLAEQDITEYLRSLEDQFNCKLENTKFRIKSPDSIYQKLYERNDHPDQTPEELFGEAKDLLRYTICFKNTDDYCTSIKKILKKIICEKYKGASLDKFRNFWTPYVSGEYKGVNTVIKLPDICFDTREKKFVSADMRGSRTCTFISSFCFELQFHTYDSLAAKEKCHKYYEENRNKETSEKTRKENDAAMREIMAGVKAPRNAEFLNEISTEYILALKNSIDLMKKELTVIKETDGMYDKKKIVIEG